MPTLLRAVGLKRRENRGIGGTEVLLRAARVEMYEMGQSELRCFEVDICPSFSEMCPSSRAPAGDLLAPMRVEMREDVPPSSG